MTMYIGIDPDVDKSGYAVWDSDQKEFNMLIAASFFDVIADIQLTHNAFKTVVCVEASWLIKKSNWHGKEKQSKAVGEKIAKAVGANHQVGKLIVEWCKRNNIKCIEVKPMGKKKADEFKRLTGLTGRTNSEKRDAAMLVFGR